MDVAGEGATKPLAGMVVEVAVNAVADRLRPFMIAGFDVGIRVGGEGQAFLWYRIKEDDIKDWFFIYVKMRSFLTSLSIATFGHFWPGEHVYCGGEVVWRYPKVAFIVPDKEGDPRAPQIVSTREAVRLIELEAHIATQYPHVWLYEQIGLYLLRNSHPGWELNAEILLSFFKIAELVTATRYKPRPGLGDILRASRDLGISGYSDEEIKAFYRVRSRDCAHDWGRARRVGREQAVECKLWAEQMVYLDWWKHGSRILKSDPVRVRLRRNARQGEVDTERRRK